MPLRNDIVTIGNYTARIKNYYPSNGVVVLFDVYPYDAQANIVAGMTMTTQDGGETITLNSSNFIVDWEPYGTNYDEWEIDLNTAPILTCEGGYIATNEHFTGKMQTQDYQTTNLIITEE